MELTNLSSLAMTTAAVVYLFAAIAHAAEWAAARGAVRVAPMRSRVAVGAGGAQLEVPDEAAESEGLSADEIDRSQFRMEKYGRIGVALTIVAFLSHLVAVVTRGMAAGRFPWGNMYEFISVAMLFVVALHLFLVLRHGQRWLGLLVTMLATIGLGLAVTVFYVAVAPLVPSLHSAWFLFHIVAAAGSAGAFNVGAIASILYLVKSRAEQRGEVRGYLAKLPSAAKIDLLAYRAHAFAFPLWTFTITAGAIWAQYAWGRFWGWDPKETASLVTWVIYAAYLHARATVGWKGRSAAIIALIGVVSFWFNFVGINLLTTGMHSYSGI